jgi:hypothetical protein
MVIYVWGGYRKWPLSRLTVFSYKEYEFGIHTEMIVVFPKTPRISLV